LIIAGIDPGSNSTGYGFLEQKSGRIIVLEYGAIHTRKSDTLADKLITIYEGLTQLFNNYRPDHLALETAFMAKYPRAALVLGHTRGAIMVAARIHNMEIYEYEPRLIKRSIVGIGRASKKQIASMIQKRLLLKEKPAPADAADALSVAYCHLIKQRSVRLK
jgi:crossover junction endodeoxyribonuclease RuvC